MADWYLKSLELQVDQAKLEVRRAELQLEQYKDDMSRGALGGGMIGASRYQNASNAKYNDKYSDKYSAGSAVNLGGDPA